MSAGRSPGVAPAFRSIALGVVLLAVTLGALQPLAHAMLLRVAADSLPTWRSFCRTASDAADDRSDAPTEARRHDACSALPQPWLVTDTGDFVRADLPLDIQPTTRHKAPPKASPRDGPVQPRAPPSFA